MPYRTKVLVMEPILDLLKLLSLRVHVFHNAKVCGNWRINEHSDSNTCFHIVTEGECLLDVPGHVSCTLRQGDLVVFPRELPHMLMPTAMQPEAQSGEQQHLPYLDGKNQSGTGLLCGLVRFSHQGSTQLLDALPPVFIIPFEQAAEWLGPLLALIQFESYRQSDGMNELLNRQCELLMFYAIRHVLEQDGESLGLFAMYACAPLRKSLHAMHSRPAEKWTLAELAVLAGMSRTRFAATFKHVSGHSPMQYLTWWRMQLAWSYLKRGQRISEVAGRVGYHSEAAFSRAFSRQFGMAAGVVRRVESVI